MINTLGKDFLAAATLRVCETLLLRKNKRACSILWSVSVVFAFLEKRRSKNIVYRK